MQAGRLDYAQSDARWKAYSAVLIHEDKPIVEVIVPSVRRCASVARARLPHETQSVVNRDGCTSACLRRDDEILRLVLEQEGAVVVIVAPASAVVIVEEHKTYAVCCLCHRSRTARIEARGRRNRICLESNLDVVRVVRRVTIHVRVEAWSCARRHRAHKRLNVLVGLDAMREQQRVVSGGWVHLRHTVCVGANVYQ